MRFAKQMRSFSGVFGVYERATPLATGAAGMADRNAMLLNDPTFSYQTASGTKGFTAAAILLLISQGKLRLQDSVKELLAHSADPDRYGSLSWLREDVTIESLLCHTSGVPDYFDEDHVENFEDALCGAANYHYEKPDHFFPLMEAAWKKHARPYASQGTFKYSNGGFVVLAAVIEAVSGLSFREYLTEHVLGPSGMQKSGLFRLDEETPSGITRAAAYQENGRSNIYTVPVIGGGDGGAYTNPQDMAAFWTWLDPDTDPESPFAGVMETAWAPRQEGDDGLYGMGFWISRKNPRIVFLEGFDPGVQFFSYYNRDTKRSLTICLNDERMNCDEVFAQYYSIVE